MKLTCLAMLVLWALAGYAQEPPRSNVPVSDDAKLDTYFQRYCNYTGGLGIGFDASHTYDYKFRQHLKKTSDHELKRLFVLQHLYREMKFAISDFEKDVIRTGKDTYRQMTPTERASSQSSISERLADLSRFDPDDPLREIGECKQRLSRAMTVKKR